MPTPEIAELNALTALALAKYAEQAAELRHADHVTHVLGQLDGLITRTKDIDRLRAARAKPGRPKDHTKPVTALRTRLDAVLSLLARP